MSKRSAQEWRIELNELVYGVHNTLAEVVDSVNMEG